MDGSTGRPSIIVVWVVAWRLAVAERRDRAEPEATSRCLATLTLGQRLYHIFVDSIGSCSTTLCVSEMIKIPRRDPASRQPHGLIILSTSRHLLPAGAAETARRSTSESEERWGRRTRRRRLRTRSECCTSLIRSPSSRAEPPSHKLSITLLACFPIQALTEAPRILRPARTVLEKSVSRAC